MAVRKKDVLLVQPMQTEYTRKAIFQPGVEIPLNLLSLEAYLDRLDISCGILDLRTVQLPRQVLRDTLRQEHPKVVGLSAYTSEIDLAGQIAGDVRRLMPDAVIVIGGYQATAEPEETLERYGDFDHLVHGEGEVAFGDFVSRVLKGLSVQSIPGLAYRGGGRIVVNPRQALIRDLDTLPFPKRERLDLRRYVPKPGTGNFLRLPSTGIMASRGCPFRCAYCSKGVWGTTVRFRSVENVLKEIEECMERHGIRDFRFYDDVLPLPVWDFRGFCSQVLDRGLSISWNCYSRVDLINRDLLCHMKKAGCYHIKLGIEFGTEASMERTQKRTTLIQAREAVRHIKDVGIECKASFILGVPGETTEDCLETIRFAVDVSPDLASFYPYYPVPGSVFAKRLKQDSVFAETLMPLEEREALARMAYRCFYLRPGYVLQRFRRMVRYPARETRVLFSALWMMGGFYLRQAFERLRRS